MVKGGTTQDVRKRQRILHRPDVNVGTTHYIETVVRGRAEYGRSDARYVRTRSVVKMTHAHCSRIGVLQTANTYAKFVAMGSALTCHSHEKRTIDGYDGHKWRNYSEALSFMN